MDLANWALRISPKFTTVPSEFFYQIRNPEIPITLRPNQNIVIGNLSFENVEKFNYLGVTVTNTNDIREKIKRRINIGKACYYSLEKI